ncbi:MAG: tyrosine-type recombinase/integrase [Planctomycetota bacterium]|jgi:integrase
MSYLAQNKKGIWEIRWTEKNDRGQPRSRVRSTRTSDFREAQTVLDGWRAAEADAQRRLTTPTFHDLVEEYEAKLDARGTGGATQREILRRLDTHLGKHPADRIDQFIVNGYVRSRGVAPPTMRRELGVLVAVYNHAVRQRRIPSTDAPMVDLPPPGQPRDLFLTEEQEADFHARALALPGDPLDPLTMFVAIALNTGARRGAIHDLQWGQVHLGAGMIDFRQHGKVRTNKRRVAVPITRRLRPVLEQAERERQGDRLFRIDTRRRWEKWVQTTPYPWVTPHVLRHTFATLNLRAGLSVWDVAGLLGDDVNTVSRTYGHHATQHLSNVLDKRFA